jgi:hypothetical protein
LTQQRATPISREMLGGRLWTSSLSLPTFILDANTHGLEGAAAAERFAERMILNMFGWANVEDVRLTVSAVQL